MFLLLGFFVFLFILTLVFAVVGMMNRNPLLEIDIKKTRSSQRLFVNDLWGLKENSPISSETALTIGLVSGALVFLLGCFLGDWLIGLAVGLFCFVFAPRLMNSIMWNRKIKAFRNTFEFGLEILLTALGIGMSLKDALMEASRNSPEPVKTEFARVSAEIAVGIPEEEAFKNLAERIPCLETEEMRDAIGLYKNVGGSKALDLLRAVLTNLREGMNADFQVRQQTKGAKTSAIIVALIPVAYFSLMLMIAPDLFGPLITTDFGKTVLFISLLIMGFGAWLIFNVLRNIEQF